MVGMGMGFDDPFQPQALRAHEFDHPGCAIGAGAAGLGIVIQHRVDHGCRATLAVMHDIRHGAGRLVEKRCNLCAHFFDSLKLTIY